MMGDGMPIEQNDAYSMLMDQAVSGGTGTSVYLGHMLQFASFAAYLKKTGTAAFTQEAGPDGATQASATDGTTTMNVGVQLNPNLEQTTVNGYPVRGIATVRMALPDPLALTKIVTFGVSLAEIPPGLAVGNTLIQALFKPLLQQLTQYVQTTVENWLEVDVGESIDELGDAVADAAGEAAEAVGEETAEVVVEEAVVAELAIDLSAAVPAFAVLGLLIAIPLLLTALAKQFELHFEINNETDHDFQWSVPYSYDGAMTAQPATSVLPKMGTATDSWGDKTDVPVVYQLNFSSMNKSGYEGTGFVLRLTPTDIEGQDIGAAISIPWIEDNALWLGDVDSGTDWEDVFNNNPVAQESVNHGNQRFYTTLSIDALSGNQDVYHCVLRILPI
jgi:hypothetical protein